MSKAAKNNSTMLLFLILGVGSLSLPISTIMIINAQAITEQRMGVCAVGAGGPCNGDHNFDGRHDTTGQCILSNGCGIGKEKQ